MTVCAGVRGWVGVSVSRLKICWTADFQAGLIFSWRESAGHLSCSKGSGTITICSIPSCEAADS
jgi:hypothetical protein